MHEIWDEEFHKTRKALLRGRMDDMEFSKISKMWLQKSVDHKYSYQFDWLGVPIIQMPADLLVFQDIVFTTQPDLIIETGVARGGSLIFWASMQNLCGIDGKVLGIDIDIRSHSERAISSSRFSESIQLIRGSSTDLDIFSQVKSLAGNYKKVMVVLDSNHTHDHVLRELELYADLVSAKCFLLVLDTVIDDLKVDSERPWGPGASPKSAVTEYMQKHPNQFHNAVNFEQAALLSVAPLGFWIKSNAAKE
jgi:cephalosporin hydroxylase